MSNQTTTLLLVVSHDATQQQTDIPVQIVVAYLLVFYLRRLVLRSPRKLSSIANSSTLDRQYRSVEKSCESSLQLIPVIVVYILLPRF